METIQKSEKPVIVRSNDPKVLDLVRYLGIDPDGVSKVVITIEAGKRVKTTVTRIRHEAAQNA